MFFTLNRSSTRRHPAHPVSVLILHPRKISSVVTSYDTEIMHRNAFDNAMSCPSTGYDRHNIHTNTARWFGHHAVNRNETAGGEIYHMRASTPGYFSTKSEKIGKKRKTTRSKGKTKEGNRTAREKTKDGKQDGTKKMKQALPPESNS